MNQLNLEKTTVVIKGVPCYKQLGTWFGYNRGITGG